MQNTIEIKLANLLRLGIYLTVFIPLIILKPEAFISPFNFGKVLVFRTLIEILGIVYIILILKDRSYLPKFNNIFWALFLFTLTFSLTTITSAMPYQSFWGTLERMGGLWTFWHYFLFFIILTSVFTKREHWYKLFNLTILSGILSALYGFGQKTSLDLFIGSGDRARIFGTLGNAALFAGYELFIVFLSLIMYLDPKNIQKNKFLYLIAFAISSVAVLMTAVRGSLMGLGIGLIFFAFLWAIYNRSNIGKTILKGLISFAVLFVIFSLLFGGSSFVKNSKYLSRITNLSPTSVTVQTRFWAWGAGLKGWTDSPKTIALGWGPENFNIPFSKYFNPKFFTGLTSETFFDRAHNMFIEILVTMGVIGLLAYVNIFISLFKSLKKILKNENFIVYGVGLMAMLVAYIIHNSFIFDTASNFIIFFIMMGFISYLNSSGSENMEGEKNSYDVRPMVNKSIINMIAIFLIIGVSILIYKTNILPARANNATADGIIYGRQGDFDNASKKFKKAITFNSSDKYEIRNRFAQYLVGKGGPSVKEEKVREAYKYALVEIDKNINESPINYLPYLYGSRLNIILGQDDIRSPYTDIALEYSNKALDLSSTFVRTYYELGQAYLNKKDYKRALEYYQKAVDLNPDTGISHWYLGVAKINSGDLNGINDLERAMVVENHYSPDESDYLQLINIYIKNNDFVRIAGAYEKIIANNKKNPQHYASLGVAYANIGRIDEAVLMARKAVELDPSFESDARAFVKALGREF